MTYFNCVNQAYPQHTPGKPGAGVQAGLTGFEHLHGMSAWDSGAPLSELDAASNPTTTDRSAETARVVAAAYDFSKFSTLVEVGGNQGTLLTAILSAHRSLRGVLFDRPHVVSSAGSIMGAAGVADRCEIVAGDFFKCLPSGGAAYLLKSILHNWDDEQAIAILTNCRRAMGQRGTLLLVEDVLTDGGAGASGPLTDRTTPASPARQDRTEPEYRALLATAGFGLSRVIPTATHFSIVEGLPARGYH
jgi:hypothetical protein